MKYWKLILCILQGVLWAGTMVMGIGNMPSGFGACFLLLALFLTPGKTMEWLWEFWVVRVVLAAGVLLYMGHCLPMEDVHGAAENFWGFLLHLQKLFG